ncbi:MAG: sensor histidine kinase [Leptospira sp.]|nr:sensor histidine kinase [Leptospira sp.]
MRETDDNSVEENIRVYSYFNRLVSSISPLITLNEGLNSQFVNSSFLKEFNLTEDEILGKNLFSFLKISPRYKKEFLANIKESVNRIIQNSEFHYKNQIYGYTVFHFEKDIGIILKNITERKKLERKVENLHSQLLRLQESERQRISGELHDGVGQTILAAKLNFISYDKFPKKFKNRFVTGLRLIDQASQELREIYTGLYPSTLRHIGLEAAIRDFVKNFVELETCRTSLRFRLTRKLPHEIEVDLFRIIQETFTNIVKHALADNVKLDLSSSGNFISLVLKDNGKGFDMGDSGFNSSGFGLRNIRRRVEDHGGTFHISSGQAEGTEIQIRIPIAAEKNPSKKKLKKS